MRWHFEVASFLSSLKKSINQKSAVVIFTKLQSVPLRRKEGTCRVTFHAEGDHGRVDVAGGEPLGSGGRHPDGALAHRGKAGGDCYVPDNDRLQRGVLTKGNEVAGRCLVNEKEFRELLKVHSRQIRVFPQGEGGNSEHLQRRERPGDQGGLFYDELAIGLKEEVRRDSYEGELGHDDGGEVEDPSEHELRRHRDIGKLKGYQ